jgi:hypothetical protein
MKEVASPFAEATADKLILETAVAILANLRVKSFPRRESKSDFVRVFNGLNR